MDTGYVDVISGSETAKGLLGTGQANTAAGEFGDFGFDAGLVRVSIGDMSEPVRGSTITVDGDDVMVTSVNTDPISAVMAISFDKTRPVEGV